MDRVRYPCATVPPNGPFAARCGSTWIHWWSPVASANRFTRSCVISCQELLPSCLPASVGRSVAATRIAAVVSSLGKFGLPVPVAERVPDVRQEARRHHAVEGPVVVGQP